MYGKGAYIYKLLRVYICTETRSTYMRRAFSCAYMRMYIQTVYVCTRARIVPRLFAASLVFFFFASSRNFYLDATCLFALLRFKCAPAKYLTILFHRLRV